MPLKLVPPRGGKTPFWSIRGAYLGVRVDRSTKSPERATAAKILKVWKGDIERGAISRPGEPTWVDAVTAYIAATSNDDFLKPITEYLGATPLKLIDQAAIDAAAIALYPAGTAPTRNRNLYTPISAVLKHAGLDWKIRRPKGWRGTQRTEWMEPEPAFRLLRAACEVDLEFGIFLFLLLYTGPRLSEACRLPCDKFNLPQAFAYIGTTKTGAPRAVHLPPVLLAALASHPRGLDRRNRDGTSAKAFRFVKCGRIYQLLAKAKEKAGPDLGFVTFHIFCHTWATWMRQYGGLDLHGLVGTDRWKDPASAARYAHVVASEQSKRSDMLPVEKAWKNQKLLTKPNKTRAK